MVRLNIVLLLAVIASALYLVRVQYDSRRLYVENERALAEARRLGWLFVQLWVARGLRRGKKAR